MAINWKSTEGKKWPLIVRILAGWMAAVCAFLIFYCIPLDDRLVQIFLQGPRSYSALMNREIEAVPDYQRFLSTVYYHARVLCADGLVTPGGEALTPQAISQQKLLSRQALEQLQQSEEYASREILLYLRAEGEETISSSLLRSPDEIPQGYEIVFQLKDGSIGGNSLLLDVCDQMSYLVGGTAFSSTQEILVEDITPTRVEPQSFLSNAKLVIAVKQVPSSDTGTLGFAYRWINNSAVPTLACILVGLGIWGLLCLAVWLALRKTRRAAAQWAAGLLRRVPLLIKLPALGFLLFSGYLLLAILSCAAQSYLYGYSVTFFASPVLAALLLVIDLPLVWLFWLEFRFNLRHTLRTSLTARLIRRCKQFAAAQPWKRRAILKLLLPILIGPLCLMLALPLSFFCYYRVFYYVWDLQLAVLLFLVLFLGGAFLFVTGLMRLNRFLNEANQLADKLTALRAGEHTAPLSLPEGSLCAVPAADLNALEEGIQARVEQQMRAERLKLELITNVSHDLKTPLTSIINYAGLLCEETLEQPAADYAKILKVKADRLKTMVRDVFEVSKAASGELPLQTRTLDLAKLIRQTLADMDEAIEASPLSFVTQLPEQAWILADGDRLYRVFQNLYTNALAYSLPGSRVYTQMERGESRVSISIKNVTRDPIAPEDAEHLLERFVQGDSARSGEGSGLGLSIAKSFAEACGGRLSVHAVADLFCVLVEFPLCPPPAPEPVPERTPESPSEPVSEPVPESTPEPAPELFAQPEPEQPA